MTEFQKKEQAIRDTVYGLSVQFDELRQIDPVGAVESYRQILQYLNERLNFKTTWTVAELEELGYLTKVH